MHGTIQIFFNPDQVGIDSENLPTFEGEDVDLSVSIGQLKEVIQGSELKRFRPSANVASDGLVTVRDKKLVVCRSIIFDLETESLTVEFEFRNIELVRIRMQLWITVNPDKDNSLQCGIYHYNNEDHAIVHRDPTPGGNDLNRMQIIITSPTIEGGRELLLNMLRGKNKPENPWFV